jgi:hypothetical protein
MRRYQEGRQRQELRIIFKPLKEWYGKTDESQWTILRRLPYVWPNERSSKTKNVFIRRRSHWRGVKLVKDATKNFFFSDRVEKLVKCWNRCVEVKENYVEN